MNAKLKIAAVSLSISFLLLVVHWTSVQVYSQLCAPRGFWGFVSTMFTMASPPCQFVLTLMSKTSELYLAMWISMAAGVCTALSALV